MSDSSAFSPDYTAARARFRSSAIALGCRLEAHKIGHLGPDGEELTIELAMIGDASPERAVVVSSGLHGIEGYLGAAVQAALLEERLGGFTPPPGTAIVLLFALNPFGFAWNRRVNEQNIDLNRNFLLSGERYVGSPEGYAALDPLLNPVGPPITLDPFLLQAALQVLRHGMGRLKDVVAGGQYDFPRGLFFGGHAPSRTQLILRERLGLLFHRTQRVLHVDFHSGLGRRGHYKLLVDHAKGSPHAAALASIFGADVVEPWDPKGVSYEIRGGLGRWCKAMFPNADYDVLTCEFGTVSILRVIDALRLENQTFHHAPPGHPSLDRARKAMMEAFVPSDGRWRNQVVQRGLAVVERAVEAMVGETELA